MQAIKSRRIDGRALILMAILPMASCQKNTGVTILPQAPKPMSSEPKSFGIYQWNKGSSYVEGLETEIGALGIAPRYALYFTDLKRGFPAQVVAENRQRGVATILSQEICVYFANNYRILDSVLAGRYDSYFRRMAAEARGSGAEIYYRFGYEMNGGWVAWGERPEQFVKAWHRIWEIFHDERAHNVRWVFSPNVVWGRRTIEKDILPYYPGDRFVDVVGLDGYNFGDGHSRHHHWKTWREVFDYSLTGMKTHFPHKPLWIAEIGCAADARKPEWIRQFLRDFAADPDIRAFIWFNEDKQYAGEPNWRLDSDGESMETFRQWAVAKNSISSFSLPGGAKPAPALRSPFISATPLIKPHTITRLYAPIEVGPLPF